MQPVTSPSQLLERFLEAVYDVPISDDSKAEVVINLAKMWGLDDLALKQALAEKIGSEAADHPYFHWSPRPRFSVGDGVRVIDGAPQALGHSGRVTAIDSPKQYGVRGMSRGYFFTVVLDDQPGPWGFREEQLEPHQL